jgi:hypothetical protein
LELDDRDLAAIAAWNLAGGMNWEALPIVIEVLGVEDVEDLVRRMALIRDEMDKRRQMQ